MISFDWDEKKNKSNRKKHGIWFEEAVQVFDDQSALRFLLLGACTAGRVLVVVFCERESASGIRIISARKATKKESKTYEKGI